VRNVRRDGMEQLKRQEKDGEISQDAHHKVAQQVQELTDSEIKQINDLLAAKETEIMTI
jgi:ribosome recycling factor